MATLVRRIQDLYPGKILYTVEEPVEQDVPGIIQIPVADKAGRTFAAVLRSLLRCNPDVIVVGEIRDGETAQVATQAALTGHLVLGTLHTNTAVGAVSRLISLGVPRYYVADTLRAVLAQRLVRAVCRECGTPVPLDADLRRTFPALPAEERQGSGCHACYNGFRGRVGIGELLVITQDLAMAISDNATATDLQRRAKVPSLLANGIQQIQLGRTTLSEVLTAAWSPEDGWTSTGHTGESTAAK